MARYSIDGQILTDIADAIRGKYMLYEPIGEPQIACTPGADPDNGMWYNGEAGWSSVEHIFVFKIPGASKYKFNLRTRFFNNNAFYYAPGEWDTKPADAIKLKLTVNVYDYEWEVVGDVVTLFFNDYLMTDANGGYGFYLTVDGFSNTIIPEEMAIRIGAVPALDESLLHMSGDVPYKFYQGQWDKFIELYGNQITTKDIGSIANMFNSSKIEKIPFEINCKTNQRIIMTGLCSSCSNLTEPPVINNAKPSDMADMFKGCANLREFPEGYGENWDWSEMEASSTASKDEMFQSCLSLRKLPMGLFKHGSPSTSYSYHPLRSFYTLYALDEIVDFPYPHTIALTATSSSRDIFYNSFSNLSRIKNFTFASDIGTMSWAKMTMDFTKYFGWCNSPSDVINYNSGITINKRVEDDATYQELKNDPDWFTSDVGYSRYNHDSAVATINSLPDCSAYAATNGANTIKFKGTAGSKTDGGAINTLTDEEIAVAAAKGWTVTLA